jgi:hypothetical protein
MLAFNCDNTSSLILTRLIGVIWAISFLLCPDFKDPLGIEPDGKQLLIAFSQNSLHDGVYKTYNTAYT